MSTKTKTLRVRIKDKHAKRLSIMSRSVNYVWNYINELSRRSIRERSKFLSGYDLQYSAEVIYEKTTTENIGSSKKPNI